MLAEPRHIGAAYMLSLSLYFTGAFREAQHLFKQLLSPGIPMERKKVEGLRELDVYAQLECLRLDYWDGLILNDPMKAERELNKRNWKPDSMQAFHLFLANGRGAEWMEKYHRDAARVNARVTDRNNQVRILKDCSDADMAIGAHLEAVQGSSYQFVPLSTIKTIEMGRLKRWIKAQVLYQNDSRETVYIPLVYLHSMGDPARGVQEGLETVLRPIEGLAGWVRAFGQKQLRSPAAKIGLAEVAVIDISLHTG